MTPSRRVDPSVHREPPASSRVEPLPERLQVLLRPPGRALISRRYDVRVYGADRVPATGAQVLAANHMGWWDGPLMIAHHPRPVHALTKREMFEGRLGTFLHAVGQIRLDREGADLTALRSCLRVLRDGGVVGIFPEGTRGSGDLALVRSGAAYLASVTGAPIVPLIFLGTRSPGATSDVRPPRGSRIDLVYGVPFSVPRLSFPRRQVDVRAARDVVRARMRSLLDEALEITGGALPGPIPGDLDV